MIGQNLSNRYSIKSELGRGGMGVVYRASDPLLNRDVAIKLIPRGVSHRDIKPEYVMVVREDSRLRVRIMDFGLARGATESRITKTRTIAGTLSYRSPEQVAGSNIDNRTDIYSLGTVLYECMTGEPPFAGELQSVL